MNMMDGPKFRRKHTSATRPRGRAEAAPAPQMDEAAEKALQDNEDRLRRQVEARLKAEAEQEAHLAAQAEARQRAEEEAETKAKARRKAEFEEMAKAEAMRRVMQARERRQAQERAARDIAERERREAQEHAERAAAEKERADRETAREQARLAAERRAHDALAAAERKKEAELAQLAEQRRREEEQAAEETRRTAEKARRENDRRLAEARAADEAAEDERRRDAERRSEQQHLSDIRRRAAKDAGNAALRADTAHGADSEDKPLSLTDMLPVTNPAAAPAPADLGKIDVDSAWNGLADLTVSAAHLDRNRIVTARQDDPAHAAFDVLRTRLMQTLKDNGWRRVAITSPGQGCGKTFTVANLAISLSRQENCRTLVMDLDLRRPSLHNVLGIKKPGPLGDVLRGIVPPEDHLRRMGENPVNAGRNIAFGLNDRVEKYPAELLQDPRTALALESIEDKFAPDVMLFDLPPALFCDDVIAFRPMFDGVLLVVGGGLTTEREIKEVERRLGEKTPLLGMILNKAEGSELHRYGY